MRDVLVIGCGRSGTSMAAGTLAGAGYFMGERLHPARPSNPKGFYESGEINQVNEALLAPLIPEQPEVPAALRRGQRWLAELPLEVELAAPGPEIGERMKKAVERRPFCFKDPRFCYTLPLWRPLLADAVFLCVFRHPASSARSIVQECRDMENLHNLTMDFGRAVGVWSCMYRHVLARHRSAGDWLFVEYRQFFEPPTLRRIAAFTGAALDDSFPEPSLERTRPAEGPSAEASEIYAELCRLAGYEPPGNR